MNDATASSLWNELLEGDWVLIERREGGTERTFVLRRATDAERIERAFTAAERAVLSMAIRASALKIMAAELGLSTSRVAEILGNVRAKLGASTHADLLQMASSFGARARAADGPLGYDASRVRTRRRTKSSFQNGPLHPELDPSAHPRL